MLDKALAEGEFIVKRKNGQSFSIRPSSIKKSAPDIEGIDLRLLTTEIIDALKESLKRSKY